MRIGIEARWITLEKTGFGNYALNLLKELGAIDNRNEYFIYLNKEYKNDEIFLKSNFHKVVIPKSPEIYKHIHIPLDIIGKKRKFDFFHFLYNAPSLITPCPFVLTIHDVSYKYVPKMISLKDRLSIVFQLYLNARKAKKIVAVSETSKKDISKFFRVSGERIEVIYEAVDDSFRRTKGEEKKNQIAKKYRLPKKFILYVGTYLPHKNLETLVHAYHELKIGRGISHSLVLAGKKGRNYTVISKLISKLGLEEDVSPIGFVPDEELPYIYSLSDLFVFPSLYEGFGLPLLEAMACGVPIIASNSSCLPEIGGDAVLYFSPKDIQDLTVKISDILNDENLRSKLIGRGIERQKIFSWRRMAEKTLKLYESVYEEVSTASGS